jgi:hypothetical protein
MKTTQYVRQGKAIAVADSGGIRQRWLWGLRLLRDGEAMSESGKSLKHGVTDQLIAAAKAAGLKLSAREIQARLQCARVYPTEAQIRRSTADFEHWSALVQSGFPDYEAPEGEPPADHRTDAERDHDRARALLNMVGEQGALFPLSDFEPGEAILKDLAVYMEEQDGITERFARRGRRRHAYFDRLVAAADGDLSMTWAEAHARLGDGTEVGVSAS